MKPIEAEKQRRKARVRRDYDKTIDSIRKADVNKSANYLKADNKQVYVRYIYPMSI